jgi:hypothetical protein
VSGGREPGHVHPDLGDHHVRSGPSDPGDLIETPDRPGERGDQLLDLGFDRGDIRAGLVDPGQHRAQQERVVIGEAPHERLLQPRGLGAHPGAGQLLRFSGGLPACRNSTGWRRLKGPSGSCSIHSYKWWAELRKLAIASAHASVGWKPRGPA